MSEQIADRIARLAPQETYYTTKALAALLGVAESTLERWRKLGCGPDYLRLSFRCVRYTDTAVREWSATKRCSGADDGC